MKARVELHCLDRIASEHAHSERQRCHGDHSATGRRYLDNLNVNKQTKIYARATNATADAESNDLARHKEDYTVFTFRN